MAKLPIILLPPSEGKAPGGRGPAWRAGSTSFPELDDLRLSVATALGRAMKGSAATRTKLMGVKGDTLAQATDANREVLTAPTMPAIERFTGVLYDELDVTSLTKRDRTRLSKQVLIFSGLWGVVRPDDPIPDHRLKMNVALAPLGRLSTWWKPSLTDALRPVVSGTTVWNLLPGEHDASWAPPLPGSDDRDAPAAMISVKFLDEKRSRGAKRSFTTVSHWNKLLKGALVRFVLATGADAPDALSEFVHPEGYVFDPSLTELSKDRIIVSMVRPPV